MDADVPALSKTLAYFLLAPWPRSSMVRQPAVEIQFQRYWQGTGTLITRNSTAPASLLGDLLPLQIVGQDHGFGQVAHGPAQPAALIAQP